MNKPFLVIYLFNSRVSYPDPYFPEWREDEIQNNRLDAFDKYKVWEALNFAVKDYLGKDLKDLNPQKLESGKPVIDGYHISLSHSGGKFLVAISSHNVGADIQKISQMRHSALEIHNDIYSKRECKELLENTNDFFYNFKVFTRKEALYKFVDPKIPFDIDTKKTIDTGLFSEYFYTDSFLNEYGYFSVCSELIKEGYEVEIKNFLKK